MKLNQRAKFTESEISSMMKGILTALAYMHDQNIVHRDLKPENILVVDSKNSACVLKIADFGTARKVVEGQPMTNYVSTRWYRAPECLLSSQSYGKPADIFALGCILGEFMTLKPIFAGSSSMD